MWWKIRTQHQEFLLNIHPITSIITNITFKITEYVTITLEYNRIKNKIDHTRNKNSKRQNTYNTVYVYTIASVKNILCYWYESHTLGPEVKKTQTSTDLICRSRCVVVMHRQMKVDNSTADRISLNLQSKEKLLKKAKI